MKIGMILDSVFPPDIRVEKETRTLIKAGHEVYLLCLKDLKLPDNDVYDGIRLCRCDFGIDPYLVKVVMRILFWNYKLVYQVRKFVEKYSIDVLNVHDLPMIKSVLTVEKTIGIPVIADLYKIIPQEFKLR